MSETLDLLIERIKAKLVELNLSPREASIDATGKPDAIRNIIVRRSMPSGERLDQIATTLSTTADWLLGRENAIERTGARDEALSLKTLRRLPKNLPIYGTALGADITFDDENGVKIEVEQVELHMATPIDHMARPTGVAGRQDVYVVIVSGTSMEPRFDEGRRVLAEAKRTPRAGDDVIVQLRAPIDDGEEVTHALIKQLVKRKAGSIVLRQFNPDHSFELELTRVHSVHRIMPWDEALGF
jgi:phage repressor protein C with HTH and peptisase S24 domain